MSQKLTIIDEVNKIYLYYTFLSAHSNAKKEKVKWLTAHEKRKWLKMEKSKVLYMCPTMYRYALYRTFFSSVLHCALFRETKVNWQYAYFVHPPPLHLWKLTVLSSEIELRCIFVLKRTYVNNFPRDHQFCNKTNILCFKSWLNPNQLLLILRILSFVPFSQQSK